MVEKALGRMSEDRRMQNKIQNIPSKLLNMEVVV